MNTEIDFVKQHAYMLSEGDNNTVGVAACWKLRSTELATTYRRPGETKYGTSVPNTEEYTGSWVQIDG